MRIAKILALAVAVGPLAAVTALAAGPSYPSTPIPTATGNAEPVWCKRVCKAWGWCGHGYNKYRCCKRSVCH